MLNDSLKLIKTEYGFNEELSYDQIHDGPDNNVYVITVNGSRYALRESKRLGKSVTFETELLIKLNQLDFSVPKIIKTTSGNYFLQVEDKQLVLFEFISGDQIDKLSPEHLETNLIDRGASKLGELHSLTNNLDITTKPSRSIFTEFDRLLQLDKACIERFKDSDQVVEQVKSFYKEAQTRIESKNEPYGIIHNDYRIQNLIYTDKNCYIIDFDWACPGPLLKDLGLAIAEWSMFTKVSGPSKEAINKFLEGYNRKAPHKVTYNKDLFFWICFACLSDTCTFLVDVCNSGYPDKVINDVDQCYMYRKFKYFYQEIN